MKSLRVGDTVALINRENNHTPEPPPFGAVGTLVAWDSSDLTWEVDFPDHLWSAQDPTWFYPSSWLVKLDNKHQPEPEIAALAADKETL